MKSIWCYDRNTRGFGYADYLNRYNEVYLAHTHIKSYLIPNIRGKIRVSKVARLPSHVWQC